MEHDKYLTDKNSDTIEKIIENNSLAIEDAMDKISKIERKIKFKAFGKTTINNKKKERPEKEEEKRQTEDNSARKVYEEQEDLVAKEIQKIKETKNGKVGQVWEIRKKVIGGKKAKLPPTSITNPITKKLVVNKIDIQEVTLKYCMDTLANNIPEEAFSKEINDKIERVKQMLTEKD